MSSSKLPQPWTPRIGHIHDEFFLNHIKWDLRFLRLAKEISTWSKDPSTKCGCIVVRDRKPLVYGYNGFPSQIKDDPELLNDRPFKMKWMVHGEANAIYNATEAGVSLKGSTFYIVGLPCCEACALAIIRVGGVRVVIQEQLVPERWVQSCLDGAEKFNRADIEYVALPLI